MLLINDWKRISISTSAILIVSVAVALFLEWLFGGGLAAWVQAIGATLAIVTGFAVAAIEIRTQREAADEKQAALETAAYLLGFNALQTVTDRLDAALTPSGSAKRYALRGERTTEMIVAMREFDTSRLTGEMLTPFIQLRSHVHAINKRIAEVYKEEERGSRKQREARKADRLAHLESAVRVRAEADHLLSELQRLAKISSPEPVYEGPYLEAYDPEGSGTELSNR